MNYQKWTCQSLSKLMYQLHGKGRWKKWGKKYTRVRAMVINVLTWHLNQRIQLVGDRRCSCSPCLQVSVRPCFWANPGELYVSYDPSSSRAEERYPHIACSSAPLLFSCGLLGVTTCLNTVECSANMSRVIWRIYGTFNIYLYIIGQAVKSILISNQTAVYTSYSETKESTAP